MMTDKFRDKYRIPSTRLQNWDYGWAGAYFITICTKNRAPYFGEISNGKMELSPVGVLADVFWYEIKNHAQNVELDAFVVMPNHVHGILILNKIDVPEIVNDIDNNGGEVGGGVETRHALSLQSLQSLQSQQSLRPPQSPQSFESPKSLPPRQTIGQKRFQNQGKNTVSSIIGSYKSAVTKHAHRLGYDFAWQERFYDHIIRNEKSYYRIAEYIRTNPLKWQDDRYYA